jgi:hypothetical protein
VIRLRRAQTLEIFCLTDFHRAKRSQMIGDKLTIEQCEPADLEPRNQPGKRHL